MEKISKEMYEYRQKELNRLKNIVWCGYAQQ